MGLPVPLRVLLTLFLLLSIVLQWVLGWLLQVIFIAVSYPFIDSERRQDICGRIFRFISFLGMDALNPGWTVKVIKPFPKLKEKKVLLMMNHLSAADPFLSIRSFLPKDLTYIAKDDLFRVPFGGWCMHNADDLRVCFKNKRSGFDTVKGTVGVMMEQARRKLNRGRMLAIFPEGIRNKDAAGGLLPFRLGFFTLAVEEGATIVPMAISGTDKCWPLHSLLVDSATAYFSCGEPIDASKFKTAEELRDYVWQAITDIRESLPDRVANKKKEE